MTILPRVLQHRASEPQGSSKLVLPWQVIMDQLICAFLSQTHNWYEVGMLNIPAVSTRNASSELQLGALREEVARERLRALSRKPW